MKRTILASMFIFALSGCAQQSRYPVQVGDAARISTDRQIQEVIEGTYASFGSDKELVFSNIYTIQTIRPGGQVSWQVCSLFRASDWSPGEYKQAHLHRGVTTITDSNVLTGACDLSRYPSRPINFVMKSGIRAEQVADETSSGGGNAAAKPQLRERVEPSENDIAHAQNMIKEMLKDPESARFRRIYGAQGNVEKIAICGEVNAKNSYGGYTGYKPFMVFEDGDQGFIWDSNADGYSFDNMMIEEICPAE
jgi:hypothetical protein